MKTEKQEKQFKVYPLNGVMCVHEASVAAVEYFMDKNWESLKVKENLTDLDEKHVHDMVLVFYEVFYSYNGEDKLEDHFKLLPDQMKADKAFKLYKKDFKKFDDMIAAKKIAAPLKKYKKLYEAEVGNDPKKLLKEQKKATYDRIERDKKKDGYITTKCNRGIAHTTNFLASIFL